MVLSSIWVPIMIEPDLDLFRFLLSRLLLELLKEVDKSVDRFAVYLLVFAMADNHLIPYLARRLASPASVRG